jgi:hypothetical protein
VTLRGPLLLLLLLFLLGRGLFDGIRAIEDGLCTSNNVFNFSRCTLLCEECRLVLAASIPDDGADKGEQNECADDAASNCASIRTSIAGYTRSRADGHRTLLTGARRGRAG